MESFDTKLTHTGNPEANPALAYPEHLLSIASLQQSQLALDEISQWPNYQATPLHSLDSLATEIGVSRIWYKDESQRFHLKSFKALGGAYAVARQLQARVKQATGESIEISDLLARRYDKIAAEVVISCATDGNHGRSVAWGCQMFGCQCVIYIHRDVSRSSWPTRKPKPTSALSFPIPAIPVTWISRAMLPLVTR